MPAYSRNAVAELRQMCETRGIEHDGLTKTRLIESMRDAVHDELMRMVASGILAYDHESAWNSPLVIVKRNDGGIRLVNN